MLSNVPCTQGNVYSPREILSDQDKGMLVVPGFGGSTRAEVTFAHLERGKWKLELLRAQPEKE